MMARKEGAIQALGKEKPENSLDRSPSDILGEPDAALDTAKAKNSGSAQKADLEARGQGAKESPSSSPTKYGG